MQIRLCSTAVLDVAEWPGHPQLDNAATVGTTGTEWNRCNLQSLSKQRISE